MYDEKEKIEKMIRELVNKTKDNFTNDMMAFLGFHDPNYYRKKTKGFTLPFNIRDKSMRIPEDDLANRYKVRNKKHPFANVKELVKEIRDQREKKK